MNWLAKFFGGDSRRSDDSDSGMEMEPPARQLRAHDYCFSSLVMTTDQEWTQCIHPTDLKEVRQIYQPYGWQLLCFQYRGREGEYDVLFDGVRTMRVREAIIKAIPEPKYKYGQLAFAPRKQMNGRVRMIDWHWKRKRPYYRLEFNGRMSGFWYFDSDLEPEHASERG